MGLKEGGESTIEKYITVEVKIPKFNLEIEEDELNIGSLEEEVLEIAQGIGREILPKLLEKIDDKQRERREVGLKNLGWRKKYLTTRLGDICYKRRLYKDREGNLRYLLDERIGLEKNQRVTIARRKLETLLAFVLNSYREAESITREFLGGKRSFESIRREVIAEGEKIKKQEEEKILKLQSFPSSNDKGHTDSQDKIAYLEIDSTTIHYQREKKRRGEIKLALGYKGKEKRYPGGKKESKKLKEKFIYGGIEEGKTFMNNLSFLSEERLNLSQALLVVVGGDGAPYIREGAKENFPGSVYHLSRFHLFRNLKRALGYHKALQAQIKGLLKKDRLEDAIMLIEKEIKEGRGDKDKLSQFIGYLIENRQGIGSLDRLKQKLPKEVSREIETTGAMEGNVDKAVANRFKKRSRRWTKKGSDCLLKVGLKFLNGEWESWWRKDRDAPIVEIEKEKMFQKIDKAVAKLPVEVKICRLPIFYGPHQARPWVKALRQWVNS